MSSLLGFIFFVFPVTSPVVGRGGLREGSLPNVVLNTAWLLHIIPLPQSSFQEAAGPALGALPAPQLQKNSRQPVRGGGTRAGGEQHSHAGSDGDVGASAQG